MEKKLFFFDVNPITVMSPDPARPNSARPGPAMTLLDDLFLESVKIYELETTS